jgi:hypothetical protein
MSRFAFLAMTLTLFVLLVWLLVTQWIAPGATAEPGRENSPAPRAMRGESPNAAPSAGEEGERTILGTGEDQATAENENSSDEVWITVVRDADGSRVAGAEVIFDVRPALENLSPEETREHTELRRKGEDLYMRRFGTVVQTATDGRARVPRPRHFETYVGRKDGLHGNLHVDPNQRIPDEGLRLVLDQDWNLTIRVVDHDGQPAAPVQVMGDLRDGPGDRHPRGPRRGKTEVPSGEVVFRHLQSDILLLRQRGEGRGRFHVRCSIPSSWNAPGETVPSAPIWQSTATGCGPWICRGRSDEGRSSRRAGTGPRHE